MFPYSLTAGLCVLAVLNGAGCATYPVEFSPEPDVTILHHGELKRYYLAGLQLAGVYDLISPAEATQWRLVATTQPMSYRDRRQLMNDPPPHQDPSLLRRAASRLNDEFMPDRQRLVLGSVPLIVAFDASAVDPRMKRPAAPQLVCAGDVQRRVIAAIVYPERTVRLRAHGTRDESVFETPPVGVARLYRFNEPTTPQAAMQILASEEPTDSTRHVIEVIAVRTRL